VPSFLDSTRQPVNIIRIMPLLASPAIRHFSPVFLMLLMLGATALGAPPVRPAPAPSSSPDASQGEGLDARLQAYLAGSKKDLGALEPWQSKLFDEEAVPEYQRFIRGYRGISGGKIEADVDFESLRKYLRFYGPKSLLRESSPVVVVLRPQADCAKCVSSAEDIKRLVNGRLAHRGLLPMWTPAVDIVGTDIDAGAYKFALQKKAVGSLVVRWGLAPSEEDETRYTIHTNLQIQGFSKHEGSIEMLEAGSFERSAGKLLTDAFTELGEKAETVQSAQGALDRKETLVDLSGVWTYSQYVAFKESMRSALETLGTLEERRIGRGHAVLVFYGEGPVADVAARLTHLKTEGLEASGAPTIDGQTVHLELRASR
jgi:hypothetical protein